MPLTGSVTDPAATSAWQALGRHRDAMRDVPLLSLFDESPHRAADFSFAAAGITADLSKQRLTSETLDLLLALADEMNIDGARAAMFAGEAINATEERAALHVALRDPSDRAYTAHGEDVTAAIKQTRGKVTAFANDVLSGKRTGRTGLPFERVVNIGIGGSDLGPRCAVTALADHIQRGLDIDFVATPDAVALNDVLAGANPDSTLFIVCSKSFSTAETMTNARAARAWLTAALGEAAVQDHMAAVTANAAAAADFGIDAQNVFPMWDWVGGRYSLWSSIGLSIALSCGPEVFDRLLDGAHGMDRHFETAPLAENLPVLMALTTIWNRNFLGSPALAVLPYDHRLRVLPGHLQQLIMESIGKGVRADGAAVTYDTAPLILGGSGPESQHSFLQMIHQSPTVVPVDFIIALDGQDGVDRDHIFANCLAQSEALMRGLSPGGVTRDSAENLALHKACPGGRPSTTVLLDSLTPETIGALIALYEHKTFVEGTLWGLNSFDQWGVELGKTLAKTLLPQLTAPANQTSPTLTNLNPAGTGRDSSTMALLTAYRGRRKKTRP